MRNAGHSLLTFMKYEYVGSTNNLAERRHDPQLYSERENPASLSVVFLLRIMSRELREVVKHRAVKSLLRTMEGAEIFSILLTIMMTYKDDDILELLKKYLSRGRSPDDGPPDDGYG